MGVKDLMTWIKKTQPQSLRYIRRRWNDPSIRGKRVAIDATLLTNVFHFGKARNAMEGMEGKGAIIGWYQLISDMRDAGVKPIAIWDQKGTREWKAAEARKRLSARALALARLRHEEARVERLGLLHETIEKFESLSVEEKTAVKEDWKKRQWTRDGPPSDLPAETDVQHTSKSLEYLKEMTTLLGAYKERHELGTRTTEKEQELTGAVDQVREVELFIDEALEPGQMEESRPSSKDPDAETTQADTRTLIDDQLEEVVPKDAFWETPNQKLMTELEGVIIEDLLGGPRTVNTEELKKPTKRGVKAQVAEAGDEGDLALALETRTATGADIASVPALLTRVDELIVKAPLVKGIYERALALPTSKDHRDCKDLLIRMGVPVISAPVPYEAEGLASTLALRGLVDFVGTEDSDVIAYGAPLLRGLSAENGNLVHISGSEIQENSGLEPVNFLEFCVLLGTDASPRIPGIGMVTGYKLIQKYGTIENILENEPKIKAKISDVEEFLDMVNNARMVFNDLPPTPEDFRLDEGVWSEGAVNDWLEENHGIRFVDPGNERGGLENRPDRAKIEEIGDRAEPAVPAVQGVVPGTWKDVLGEGAQDPKEEDIDWLAAVAEYMEEMEEDEVETVEGEEEHGVDWDHVVATGHNEQSRKA